MLHVTNGDSASETMRAAGLEGSVLPWRDVLHDGPVPAGLTLAELAPVRAAFIAAQGWGSEGDILRSFRERDASLAGFAAHDEVVLWFEHDLYDQLQLIQVLDFFAGQALGDTRLSIVVTDDYLGAVSADRFPALFRSRQTVTRGQLTLGRSAWDAFRAPDPTRIADLLAGDTSALPHLGPALRRHLEQFPSVRNGLSRSEQQALEAIDAGAATPKDAYLASHHQREEAIWMGDSTFADYMSTLSASQTPLVTFSDGSPLAAPPFDQPAADFWSHPLTLTDAGRDVLHGRADRIGLSPIDRWVGGVHLAPGKPDWRWDVDAGRVVRAG